MQKQKYLKIKKKKFRKINLVNFSMKIFKNQIHKKMKKKIKTINSKNKNSNNNKIILNSNNNNNKVIIIIIIRIMDGIVNTIPHKINTEILINSKKRIKLKIIKIIFQIT